MTAISGSKHHVYTSACHVYQAGSDVRSNTNVASPLGTERMALALSLLRAADRNTTRVPLATAFCRSRLDSNGRGLAFGSLEDRVNFAAILARVLP